MIVRKARRSFVLVDWIVGSESLGISVQSRGGVDVPCSSWEGSGGVSDEPKVRLNTRLRALKVMTELVL